MPWLVITQPDGVKHVVPSRDDIDEPLEPHTPSEDCVCHPEWDDKKKNLLVHNQLH